MGKRETAAVDGIEMKYMVFGEGTRNLVILPGLSFQPVTDSWRGVEQAYAAFGTEFTVWLFDRRSNYPAGYSIREMAADTAAVMQSLGIRRADLFGASQGGMIAQYIAIDHPELVNSLILGSTMGRCGEQARQTVQQWHELAAEGRLEELAASSLDRMYSEDTLRSFRELLLAGCRGLTAEEIARYLTMTESILAFDAAAELPSVSCPALVIGCEGDRVLGAAASEELAALLGAEKYMYGSSYGHCVYDEAPDYRERMLRFLGGKAGESA